MTDTPDIHRVCFHAGLNGEELPAEYAGHDYAEMAYRDGEEERRRRELIRGEKTTDWSAS